MPWHTLSPLLSWLRRRSPRSFRPSRKPPRRSRHQPALETLEDRAVPSVAAGTPWTTYGNSSEPSVIFTIGRNGNLSITSTGVGPYDGSDDNYVGVVNLSGTTLQSLKVGAPRANDIFGFDGDGIQTYHSPKPTSGLPRGYAVNGYEGPDNYFSKITHVGTVDIGQINFIGGLRPGRQTYFSLEGAPSTSQLEIGNDLQLKLDSSKITPAQATDLHLAHIFGTETVRLPLTIDNLGVNKVISNVTLSVFLSTTQDLTGSVTGTTPFAKAYSSINLSPSASKAFNANIVINATNAAKLTAGTQYYIVVKLTSPIKETDNQNGTDPNNIVASSTSYEYVGKPHLPSIFNGGRYFKIVRDTLNGVDPFMSQGAADPTDGQHFTAAFESRGGYDNPNLAPYLDSKGIPTIGIGLNLNTLDPTIKATLAADVRAYYSVQAANNVRGYKNIDSLTDDQVITMLKTQARLAGHVRHAQAALTVADAQDLFNTVYAQHVQDATAAVGQTVWDSLPANIQWVLTDIDFNVGSVATFPSLLADLQLPGGPDLVRAGFDFVDSKRTNDVQYARTLAGFEYILLGHESQLGNKV
jgi:GH24 family phage-related lysozyme (muramidase)